MTANRALIRPSLFAGAAALAAGMALSLSAAPARAQPYASDEGAGSVAGVTVYAGPRYQRQPTTGARVESDTVSLSVSLADLDLSTRWGAREAAHRIRAAAREACTEVEERYPKDVEGEHGCYAPAVRNAMAEVQDQVGYPILAWGYH